MHDTDHAAFIAVLSSKPKLALYNSVRESPGMKECFQRHIDGQETMQIRSWLRSGISMLRHYSSSFREQPSAVYPPIPWLCFRCLATDM